MDWLETIKNWHDTLKRLLEPNGAAGSADDADNFDCVSW